MYKMQLALDQSPTFDSVSGTVIAKIIIILIIILIMNNKSSIKIRNYAVKMKNCGKENAK